MFKEGVVEIQAWTPESRPAGLPGGSEQFAQRSNKRMVGFRRAAQMQESGPEGLQAGSEHFHKERQTPPKCRNLGLDASRQEVSCFIKRSNRKMIGSSRATQMQKSGPGHQKLFLQASRQELSSFIKRSDQKMIGSRRVTQMQKSRPGSRPRFLHLRGPPGTYHFLITSLYKTAQFLP